MVPDGQLTLYIEENRPSAGNEGAVFVLLSGGYGRCAFIFAMKASSSVAHR
jgi:hypothetical protein